MYILNLGSIVYCILKECSFIRITLLWTRTESFRGKRSHSCKRCWSVRAGTCCCKIHHNCRWIIKERRILKKRRNLSFFLMTFHYKVHLSFVDTCCLKNDPVSRFKASDKTVQFIKVMWVRCLSPWLLVIMGSWDQSRCSVWLNWSHRFHILQTVMVSRSTQASKLRYDE